MYIDAFLVIILRAFTIKILVENLIYNFLLHVSLYLIGPSGSIVFVECSFIFLGLFYSKHHNDHRKFACYFSLKCHVFLFSMSNNIIKTTITHGAIYEIVNLFSLDMK